MSFNETIQNNQLYLSKMNIRFDLRPSYTIVADTREALMNEVSKGFDSLPTTATGAPVLVKFHGYEILPGLRPPVNTAAWSQRVYSLQKFNTRYKNVVDQELSTSSKKVINSELVQKSHWEAKVYDVNLGVLAYLGLQLVQHTRHFTVQKLDNSWCQQ